MCKYSCGCLDLWEFSLKTLETCVLVINFFLSWWNYVSISQTKILLWGLGFVLHRYQKYWNSVYLSFQEDWDSWLNGRKKIQYWKICQRYLKKHTRNAESSLTVQSFSFKDLLILTRVLKLIVITSTITHWNFLLALHLMEQWVFYPSVGVDVYRIKK